MRHTTGESTVEIRVADTDLTMEVVRSGRRRATMGAIPVQSQSAPKVSALMSQPAVPTGEGSGPLSRDIKGWMTSALANAAVARKNWEAQEALHTEPARRALVVQAASSTSGPAGSTSTATGGSLSGHADTEASSGVGLKDDIEATGPLAGDITGLDIRKVLDRLRSGSGQFSETEVNRMQSIFNRFTVPYTQDVHKDDLRELLIHLGYLMTEQKYVNRIANEVTSYSTMNFPCFVDFAERFAKFETDKFRQSFNEFDQDRNGRLDEVEIRKFMCSMGFTPLRAMIREAMALVDLDHSKTLGFEEFVHLFAIYRVTEGFTQSEVAGLRKEFNKKAKKNKTAEPHKAKLEIPAENLVEILLAQFGPQSQAAARQIEAEIAKSPTEETPSKDWQPLPLDFAEVLMWARRLREVEHNAYRKQFKEFDINGDGSIDFNEARYLVKTLGYTLLPETIQEAMDESHEDPLNEEVDGTGSQAVGQLAGYSAGAGISALIASQANAAVAPATKTRPPITRLDFDDFVNLMQIFRNRDGFSKAETDILWECFVKFDENKNEEVDCLELGDMLRFLGFSTQLADVQSMMAKADMNNSGSLDFREFLRLMRTHREDELKTVRTAFDGFKDPQTGLLISDQIRVALNSIGYLVPQKKDAQKKRSLSDRLRVAQQLAKQHAAETAAAEENPKEVSAAQPFTIENVLSSIDVSTSDGSFEDFIRIVDKCRALKVAEQRRCAGFTQEELQHFHQLMQKYDKDANGTVSALEIGNLLSDLGFKVGTAEERDRVLAELDKARDAAAAVGIKDVGARGTGNVNFYVFIQLLRVIVKRDDRRIVDRETRAVEQSRFSVEEVEQFREVFDQWHERGKLYEDEDDNAESSSEEAPDSSLTRHGRSLVGSDKNISKDCMRRLVRSMGLTVTSDVRAQLEEQIDQLASEGKMDFSDFLRLMRWMLDTDFAGINAL